MAGSGPARYAQVGAVPTGRKGLPTFAWVLIGLGAAVIVFGGILAAVAAVSYNSFVSNAGNSAAMAEYMQTTKILQSWSATEGKPVTDTENLAELLGESYAADIPDAIEEASITDGTLTTVSKGWKCTGATFPTEAGASPRGERVCTSPGG